MEKMTSVDFLVMLSACLLAISVPSRGESYSYGPQTPQYAPGKSSGGDECMKVHQACGGPYSCCPGLECAVYSQGLTTIGLCLPPLPPTVNQVGSMGGKIINKDSPKNCRTTGQACHPFHANTCCEDEGIECIVPPKVLGFGVCGPKAAKVTSVENSIFGEAEECKGQGQLCNTYGPFTCCKGLSCVAREPAGIGACL